MVGWYCIHSQAKEKLAKRIEEDLDLNLQAHGVTLDSLATSGFFADDALDFRGI